MTITWSRRFGERLVEVVASTQSDGDFRLDQLHDAATSDDFQARRRALVDLPWTMAAEEHGVGVVVVDRPGDGDGDVGDAIVTRSVDAVLGCWAGDCAPVVLVGSHEAIGIVHAGWRGLAAGVLDVAITALGEPLLVGVLGPCIGVCCNQFGEQDLESVAAGVHADPNAISAPFDPHGTSGSGSTVALDVPAAVRHVVEASGARFEQIGGCTGCQFDGFSHRVRGDRARHVVAVWQHSDGDASADESSAGPARR